MHDRRLLLVNRDRHDGLQVSCNSVRTIYSQLRRLCQLSYNNHRDIIMTRTYGAFHGSKVFCVISDI